MRRSYVIRPSAHELAGLVCAAQRGDDRAVDLLLAAIRPSLLGYFTRRLPRDVADDLTQVTLIRVVGALKRIQPDRAGCYIARVAQNLLRTANHRRSRDRRRYAPAVLADDVASPESPEAYAEYDELVHAVRRASRTVLPRELRTVVLALLRGQTTAEIAASQGVSPITIRTRLMRARAMLRRELPDYLPPSGVTGLRARFDIGDEAA